MTPRARWAILAFAVVGLAFAGGAAYVHYRLLTQPNYISPCDINARFNCSDAYLSRYGSFHGVPVALGGVIWFAAIALFAALSSPRRNHERSAGADDPVGAYLFVLATIGLAAILYFAYASFFVLKTGCVLCLGTYAAVIGIFVVSGSSASAHVGRLPGRLVRDVRTLVADPLRLLITLLFIVGAAGLIAYFPKEGYVPPVVASAAQTSAPGSDNPQTRFDELWARQPRVDLGIPADGANVVIVKFNDWQCPSCKAAYYAYKPILDKYLQGTPGAIKYVTKDYPLNNKCNFSISQSLHVAACEAAAAVRLARERGAEKENEMVEWLFANQATLTPDSVQAQVKNALGVSDFGREYVRMLPDIKRDASDGAALQVQYTPTFYVNGVKAEAGEGKWLAPEYFDYAIQYELKKASPPTTGPNGKK